MKEKHLIKLFSCSQDGTIRVWDLSTFTPLYSLLGGSARGGNAFSHPSRPGISSVAFDHSRIVASINNILRVYSFSMDDL